MRVRLTERSRRQYADAPLGVQRAFDRKLELLTENLRHPSLRAKKYDEGTAVWQGRITRGWRFYFQIEADTYLVLSLIPHLKYLK